MNNLTLEYLAYFVCCDNSPTKSDYKYEVRDSSYQVTFDVSVFRKNMSIIFDKTGQKPGIYSTYLSQIDSGDACGIAPPKTPSDQKIFGGGQEFISMTFFENLLKIGIQKQQLDTYIQKVTWSTRSFRYSVSDLSKFLSNINSTFSKSAFVYGLCITDRSNFKISKGSNNSTVKVFIKPTCTMRVGDSEDYKNVLGVTLNLNLAVEPGFLETTFDVWMNS
jgi:hypothetical protein